jgi:hypothetical protein
LNTRLFFGRILALRWAVIIFLLIIFVSICIKFYCAKSLAGFDGERPLKKISESSWDHGVSKDRDKAEANVKTKSKPARLSREQQVLKNLENPQLVGAARFKKSNELAIYYAENDPNAGIEWLKSDFKISKDASLVSFFASKLALLQPDQWQIYLVSLDSDMKKEFVYGAITGTGKLDAVRAWADFQKLRTVIGDSQSLESDIFQKLSKTNSDQFAQVVKNLDSPTQIETFFRYSNFSDQRVSFDTLEKIDDSEVRNDCLLLYCQGLKPDKMSNFGSALMSSNLSADEKNDALYSVVNNKFYRSPIEAARLTLLVQDGKFREDLIEKIRTYASLNEKEAVDKIEAIFKK